MSVCPRVGSEGELSIARVTEGPVSRAQRAKDVHRRSYPRRVDALLALWPLAATALSLTLIGVGVRTARAAYLGQVTLTEQQLRELQVDLTEKARIASLTLGQEVDLSSYWRGSGFREPDRRRVVESLVSSHVFGWYERRTGDGSANFIASVSDFVWMPTRTRVVVSQWVVGAQASSRVVIERVMGSVVLGDVDASTTYGSRAGRDFVGGDVVGGDKVGGNVTNAEGGSFAISSANTDGATPQPLTITSLVELENALAKLADRAEADHHSPEVIEAIRWASSIATAQAPVSAQNLSRYQRILDRAAPWVREGIDNIVRGVSSAIASHWLLEFLRG